LVQLAGSLDALKGCVDFQHFGKSLGALSSEAIAGNTANKQMRWLIDVMGRLTSFSSTLLCSQCFDFIAQGAEVFAEMLKSNSTTLQSVKCVTI
jgi:hypothetical protein